MPGWKKSWTGVFCVERVAILLVIGKEGKILLLFVWCIVTALVCLDTVAHSHILQLTTTLLLLSMPTNQRYIQYLYLLKTSSSRSHGDRSRDHGSWAGEPWEVVGATHQHPVAGQNSAVEGFRRSLCTRVGAPFLEEGSQLHLLPPDQLLFTQGKTIQ